MNKKNLNGVGFLFWVLILTWVFWVPAGLISKNEYPLLVNLLHYAGGAMPFVMTIIFLFLGKKEERTDYFHRLVHLKSITLKWWIVIIFMIPLFLLISIMIDRVFGGMGADFSPAISYKENIISIIPFAFFMLLFGPVPEEMAWRGYALNKLEGKISPFISSLLLGLYWIVWHLPLFLIDGSYQNGLGVGTAQFWLFILDKIPFTFLMTWIFNNTDRSTISAILFHFVMNFTGELLDLPLRSEVAYILMIWVFTFFVVIKNRQEWSINHAG